MVVSYHLLGPLNYFLRSLLVRFKTMRCNKKVLLYQVHIYGPGCSSALGLLLLFGTPPPTHYYLLSEDSSHTHMRRTDIYEYQNWLAYLFKFNHCFFTLWYSIDKSWGGGTIYVLSSFSHKITDGNHSWHLEFVFSPIKKKVSAQNLGLFLEKVSAQHWAWVTR